MMRGFIAITTALVLSFIILAVTLSLSSSTFLRRFNSLEMSNKQTGLNLARSCLEHALLRITQNSSYAGSETIIINESQCAILPVESLGLYKIIKTQAQFSETFTNLKATVGLSPLWITAVEEIEKL